MLINLFQTLEDRDNPDQIENEGPFKCRRPYAWMHDGYYFWEHNVQLSHWWGETTYPGNYVVCKSSYKANHELCWDLHSNYNAIEEFEQIVNKIKAENINNGKPIMARSVIEYLIKRNIMKYEGVRFTGINSLAKSSGLATKNWTIS